MSEFVSNQFPWAYIYVILLSTMEERMINLLFCSDLLLLFFFSIR